MKPSKVSIAIAALAIVTTTNLFSAVQSAEAANIQLVGLDDNNTLTIFNSNNSSQAKTRAVTGVDGTLIGIDFRPANGDLFGVSDANKIYTIDLTTGAATLVSNNPTPFVLQGNSFGVDFNPIPDAIRVVSDANTVLDPNQRNNTRLNPNTGGLAANAPDVNLVYADETVATPNIVAAAYTNSFAPSPRLGQQTTLYVIDSELDILATQGSVDFPPGISPNTGQLFTVGALGVDFGDGGFDIFSTKQGNTITNTAFAASGSTLYNINLSTGAATTLGTIGNGNANIIGLSARSVPEPGTVDSLLGIGALGLLSCFCRRAKLPR